MYPLHFQISVSLYGAAFSTHILVLNHAKPHKVRLFISDFYLGFIMPDG